MEYKLTTRNEVETIELAQNIESEKFPNMIICLEGDLGSGKTVFAKGFAGAMGIDDHITSPTFNIIKEYENGELPLYHMDVYRLEGDISELALDDYYHADGVVIIEWADMIKESLPKEHLYIKIKIIDEDTRLFIFKPVGKKYEDICEAVL
ncbi:MAG: tRNA (adenosine(37)-N6)-threonylcarbamoyltransferase complex ATPase subunit type 1 TsaE [Tenericutes bacterium]|jgi:tRNA threonylcarbamoyladenosine biosynthesis protein TsaE|nr:tRNA (adenosine(37)-N6)-threonylcarbamoyltransferase complex ATPase subunit type 1 TsaE [Mycoplasmatota bacterium]